MFTEGQLVNEKYLIQSEFAQGDFGPVYRAVDVEGGGVWLLSPMALTPEEAESLRKELEQVCTLEHAHIAPPGKLETAEQNQTFLASEFVEGRSLEELIRDEAPLALSRACSLGRQIAQALEAAHHAGVVHGDLKPASVLVVRDEDEEQEIAMVCGFGTYPLKRNQFVNLAQLAVKEDGQPLFGTPEYVSPEQAVGTSAEALDGRTDLYSLGVILYRMLTGDLPHQGANPMETLLAQIFNEPRPFSERCGCEIPVVMETLVMRALAKKRVDRPASATALIDQLAAWEERKITVRPPVAIPVARVRAPEPTSQELPAFEMQLSEAPVPSSRETAAPAGEVFAPDITRSSEREPAPVSQARPPARPELEFPQAESRAPSPEPGPAPGRAFEPDVGSAEPPVIPALATSDATAKPAGESMLISASAGRHAAAPTQGFDIQLGAPDSSRSSTVRAGDLRGTSAASAKPVTGVASGPVLFANFHPRQRRKRKWPKVLGVAAIVILIIVGTGCGWLYYTGRTYWFNPDYVRMRVSSFLGYGMAANPPQIETDAYSQSKALEAASGAAPASTQPTTAPASPMRSAAAATSPLNAATDSANSAPQEAAKRAPPANPAHSAAAAPPVNMAADSADLERPHGALEGGSAPRKHATRASHAVESPAGLVEAAITRGDYYFNRGDYDAAIRAYEEGLAHFPSNPQLGAEIARARKAQAAEAKYLQ